MLLSNALDQIVRNGEMEISKGYEVIDLLIEYIEKIDEFESLDYEEAEESFIFTEV
ncbi:hypothetical protein [Virgibacillus sp. CBA3643]|uniref:hypothetical protein n=1 Tax=Virgibacillus sp. CBA3643 TaxID=2942278 RepID=UPI0035A2CAEB